MQTKLEIISVILIILLSSAFGTASNSLSETYYLISCNDLDIKGNIIQIHVDINKKPFYVKCNHEHEGGGWTVVLNRYDGSRDFDCKWTDCVQGFGNINGEFFIGLEKLYDITSSTMHELMFVMEDFDGNYTTARYDAFAVDDENNSFMLRVLGNYTGNAGDSFIYHAGYKFLTKDKDNLIECSKKRDSPGWFQACSNSNIFGKYAKGQYNDTTTTEAWGMYWSSFRDYSYSLKKLAMLIRPVVVLK